ncbi:poly A polymerase, putative [Perkinsus marinus ATCC 50983]|uniref:Poly(A) polymerase n=1 Tax=Perkinsus marinus (strain ATCC 50983 / TXsc) TaxID=423536 RepID=C5KD15_PERM5|nr:poly A polymerase, putative [Perkinsus marinus ATCC 50983]EER17764.1 poly A polymerase, putative [Perkinsus marinus ATCC 50983]|eukprot:XP_002785968.1 poly A polymerase, putative [Perkinsus marinus ATCC 50983]
MSGRGVTAGVGSSTSSSSQSPPPPPTASTSLPPWPGVTPPVSENYPTRADYEATEELRHFIENRAPPESSHGMLKRYEVLVEIERMVNKWIYDVSAGEIQSKARVLTFGSFRLGVITPMSDIDTLVLLPNSISRDDFFTDFVETMLNRSPHVTECNPVPAAHVPIIKVKYRGICMDILAACVPTHVLSGDVDSVQEELIYDVEKRCMKSMNGIRVADKMLSLVVDTQTFRLATRVIKYWAQQRLIYSNAIGYMGGVSWAVMVGRVCQLYPNYSAKQIVERFFFVYARWQWTATRDYGNSNAPRRRYTSDRHHVMPVITPIFPTHNTTYNVQESNKRVIVREIKRGREIMELMSMNKSSGATKGNEVTWADLCAPFPFFQVYRQFLLLEISAETEKAFLKFKGLVESRIRVLVKNLETCCGHKASPPSLSSPMTHNQ